MGNKTHKQDNMVLPVLLAQEVLVSLSEHLEYLISIHMTMKVCMNKKEEYDKAVLAAKISLLIDRVDRLRKQIAKRQG